MNAREFYNLEAGTLLKGGLGRRWQAMGGRFSRNKACTVEPTEFGAETCKKEHVKKILVPTDFSPCAECALRHALALAKERQASLTLMHVVDVSANMPGWGPADPARVKKELWQQALERLQKIISAWPDKNVEVKTLIVEGLPCEEIAAAARGYDVVVIGRSMRKPFWRLFSRHTFAGVVEMAPCPLVVVCEHKGEDRPESDVGQDGEECAACLGANIQ